jgi:hypothetical protein
VIKQLGMIIFKEINMNSIRVKDRLQRAWLKVTKVGTPKPGHSTLRGELFDGTPFEFVVPDHEYESQGQDCPPLVEVGLVGNVGNVSTSGISEIILPAPVLAQGHNVRVSDQSLIKWEVYQLIKEKNQAANKETK